METLSCKPSLIDLEVWKQTTGPKRKHGERLSERASVRMMRQSELSYNKRSERGEARRGEYPTSKDGVTKCAGKYIPVPLEYGNPQGRSHTFANAQNQQTASDVVSYFVYAVQDYQLVTITNLLMEQTKSNAGAFVDEASRTLDNGFRNLSNNMAFELFYGGTASRGQISSAGVSYSAPTLSFTLANPQSVVQFEQNMTLQSSTTDGGAALQNTPGTIDAIQITSVNRGTGAISGTVVQGAPQTSWGANDYLQVLGDIGIGGSSTIAGMLGLSGLAAWVNIGAQHVRELHAA